MRREYGSRTILRTPWSDATTKPTIVSKVLESSGGQCDTDAMRSRGGLDLGRTVVNLACSRDGWPLSPKVAWSYVSAEQELKGGNTMGSAS
jgi:hypothetical protein